MIHLIFLKTIGTCLGLYGMILVADKFELKAKESQNPQVEIAKEALGKWVQTQELISKEKQDLALSRQAISDRIGLTLTEIEIAKNKSLQISSAIAASSEKRTGLEHRIETYQKYSHDLLTGVERMEAAIIRLLVRLPKPLKDRIHPWSARIESNLTNRPLLQRYRDVIAIIMEMNRFNNTITNGLELIEREDGRSLEVSAVYLGISQGYYLSADGTVAGRGFPGDSGWRWVDSPSVEIQKLISILKNETSADYVILPVELK